MWNNRFGVRSISLIHSLSTYYWLNNTGRAIHLFQLEKQNSSAVVVVLKIFEIPVYPTLAQLTWWATCTENLQIDLLIFHLLYIKMFKRSHATLPIFSRSYVVHFLSIFQYITSHNSTKYFTCYNKDSSFTTSNRCVLTASLFPRNKSCIFYFNCMHSFSSVTCSIPLLILKIWREISKEIEEFKFLELRLKDRNICLTFFISKKILYKGIHFCI